MNISALQQIVPARSYEIMHHLAGVSVTEYSHNKLVINMLQRLAALKPPARLSDIYL